MLAVDAPAQQPDAVAELGARRLELVGPRYEGEGAAVLVLAQAAQHLALDVARDPDAVEQEAPERALAGQPLDRLAGEDAGIFRRVGVHRRGHRGTVGARDRGRGA